MENDTSVAPAQDPSQDTSDAVAQDTAISPSDVAPDATQDTGAAQEAANAEVNADDTAQDKLFAGKYKTVEDMEKAYQELNSTFTKTSQEKAELSRILTEAFGDTSAAQSGATVQPSSDYNYDDDNQTPVQSQDTGVQRDLAIMKFMYMHEGADPAAIKEVLSTDPLVSSINGYEAKLEYAYLRSQNMVQSKTIATAKKEAAQATQTKIAEKQAAQVEQSSKSEPSNPDAELMEKALSGDVAARRAALTKFYL
jgi:hypothetical protein